MISSVMPFRIDVPDAKLRDLGERLARARWPEPETVDDWSQGVPLAYVRDLCAYWASAYNWRARESRLNELPQFRTSIDGLGIHFLQVRSPYPDALPLVLTHGWPGSVVEYLEVIDPLVDPVRHGGEVDDAFHVVCPSLPGYGFSDKPTEQGWGIERIAAAWVTLMTGLGYERYGLVGSDWGTSISTLAGQLDPTHVVGIHLMPPLAAPDSSTSDDLSVVERTALEELAERQRAGDGYTAIQSTRPQTLGYGLVDSPTGLCAWIVEKLWAWTDFETHLEEVLTRDEILDDVMFYWLPATATSAARLYWESIRQVQQWFTEPVREPVTVPTGCSIFPKEVPRPSRRWAEQRYADIRWWNELERGGHFPAWEQPDVFVAEVRSFFRLVR